MRILVAPDSYKGSLSAKKVGKIIELAFKKEMTYAEIDVVPMADGGEGSIAALLHQENGKKVNLKVTGPMGVQIEVNYVILIGEQTAIIEVASIVGFISVPKCMRNPYQLTTYGVGECLIHALDLGIRKFIFCLGGSITNDGGIGFLQALGVTFENKAREKLPPDP